MPKVNYNVVEPPTSGEVEDAALRALAGSGVLPLVLLASEQAIPRPEELSIGVKIRRTGHPLDGGMTIEGITPDNQFVVIETQASGNSPASAHIITG